MSFAAEVTNMQLNFNRFATQNVRLTFSPINFAIRNTDTKREKYIKREGGETEKERE